MSDDKKITSLDEYRDLRGPFSPELMEKFESNREEGELTELFKQGYEIVNFTLNKKSFSLLFSDGKEMMNLDIYIDENGELKTKLITGL